MNKAGLIDVLSKETGPHKNKAKKAVNLFFDEMSKALINGDRVAIPGFCSFFVKNYKGQTARTNSSAFFASKECFVVAQNDWLFLWIRSATQPFETLWFS
jgi:nucleoid DNA-binding protein